MSAPSKKDRGLMERVIAKNQKKEFTAKLPILLLEAIADLRDVAAQLGLSGTGLYTIEKDINKVVCFDYRYDLYQSDLDQFVDSWFQFATPKPLADIDEYQFQSFLDYIESLRQIAIGRQTKITLREAALSKLTKEERIILGI